MSKVLNFQQAAGMGPALLGGKGAGLAAMADRGFKVPPGFVVVTDVCRTYQAHGALPDSVVRDIDEWLAELERVRGQRLGDPESPLLLAVRSGAPVSMPGMMDTVLNLGITAATRPALERRFGARFALDSHRRYLESFGTVVLGIPQDDFLTAAGREADSDLNVETLTEVVHAYDKLLATRSGEFTDHPRQQLRMAIEAVLKSWNSPRARSYREIESIPDDLGTAVVVQSMVFGNRDDRSGTGVVFTRNPNTGEKAPYGDFLFRAQGEDVVSGRYQTLPIQALGERLPEVWDELREFLDKLEAWRRDMLDIEFTIEHGELFFLQVRTAKRAAAAAVRVAVELVDEGLIDRREALRRVTPEQIDALGRPHVDPEASYQRLATGLAASPGVAVGVVCLSPESAADLAQEGTAVILVRQETSPNDVHGMAVAEGVVTTRGGLVSHAAVVARGLGIPAVVGADDIVVDCADSLLRIGDHIVREGDIITIDGGTGLIAHGALPVAPPSRYPELETLLTWADELTGSGGQDLPAGQRLAAARAALGQPPVQRPSPVSRRDSPPPN